MTASLFSVVNLGGLKGIEIPGVNAEGWVPPGICWKGRRRWDQAFVAASCRPQSVLASFTRPFNGGHIQNGLGHRRSRNVAAKK
jgi:hypothetical protein